ncbi:hypothetical protein RRG08_027694 [Elysia crispata]|uniref:Uncharacterized protein n=1 Tax=Elysia crispata TaxID=231223 RepID=A0AAE1CJ67_9GAST|nr:hypothetical protein RRG08_027694 [Elysia crispata]
MTSATRIVQLSRDGACLASDERRGNDGASLINVSNSSKEYINAHTATATEFNQLQALSPSALRIENGWGNDADPSHTAPPRVACHTENKETGGVVVEILYCS